MYWGAATHHNPATPHNPATYHSSATHHNPSNPLPPAPHIIHPTNSPPRPLCQQLSIPSTTHTPLNIHITVQSSPTSLSTTPNSVYHSHSPQHSHNGPIFPYLTASTPTSALDDSPTENLPDLPPLTTNFNKSILTYMSSKHLPSTIHLPLTTIKNLSHASIISLYRPLPNPALTIILVQPLTAQGIPIEKWPTNSHLAKLLSHPSFPTTYASIPPPSCPNQLLTHWHIQVCLHDDEQIRCHNSIIDYNVSLLHSLQRNALLEPNARLGKSAYDIQTDHLRPNPPNSWSLLLDWTITSPVQSTQLQAPSSILQRLQP